MAVDLKTEWTVNPLTEAGGQLEIPSKYKIKQYSVLVRDDQNDWTTDTQVIGWCSWKSNTIDATADGGFVIKASLYNQSDDRIRSCRIIATVE